MKPYGLTPDVIADLYEAAIDDERWPHLSNIISKVTGVDAVVVWMIDNGVVSDMSVTANIRETPAPYVAHYGRLDPWQRAMLASPVDQPMISAEHVSERDLVKTEFYNDFARPAGLFRPMGVKLNLSPGMIGMVGIEQPATRKPFEPDDKRRIQPLLPHVKRALQLRLRNRQRASRADIRASALDALAFGVVVCNAMGRIAFVNAAAQALAHAGAGITLGGRKKGLGAIVPAESLTLASLIHDAAGGGAGGVLQLTGRDDMTALLILVTPLPRNLRGELGGGYALVTLRSAHDSPSFAEATLIGLFGLTPAQASIALAIFSKSPEEVAAERGIQISTLRTHLARIFLRTGAENQRDLVRLLGMVPPLR